MFSTSKRTRRWVAILGAAALALTACGGEDEADVAQEGTAGEQTQTDTTAETGTQTETDTPTEQDTDPGATGDDVEVETGQDQATEGDAAETGALSSNLEALNGSNASGTVSVVDEGDGQVTVTVTTSDVAAGAPHAQHIHIGASNECPPADAAGDDEFVSTPEGAEFYGGIQVSLTTEGDVGADSALAVERFPVASEQGQVSYERTFQLPEGVTFDQLSEGVIVQHGVADTSLGEDPSAYDGPPSPLSDAVPQEATLPALCGQLQFGS